MKEKTQITRYEIIMDKIMTIYIKFSLVFLLFNIQKIIKFINHLIIFYFSPFFLSTLSIHRVQRIAHVVGIKIEMLYEPA